MKIEVSGNINATQTKIIRKVSKIGKKEKCFKF